MSDPSPTDLSRNGSLTDGSTKTSQSLSKGSEVTIQRALVNPCGEINVTPVFIREDGTRIVLGPQVEYSKLRDEVDKIIEMLKSNDTPFDGSLSDRLAQYADYLNILGEK